MMPIAYFNMYKHRKNGKEILLNTNNGTLLSGTKSNFKFSYTFLYFLIFAI